MFLEVSKINKYSAKRTHEDHPKPGYIHFIFNAGLSVKENRNMPSEPNVRD